MFNVRAMMRAVKTYQRSNLAYAGAYEDNGEDHGGLIGVVPATYTA